MVEELAGSEELDELYRLAASESDPEDDEDEDYDGVDEDYDDEDDDEDDQGIKPEGMPHP
jgi:hypothetical protein